MKFQEFARCYLDRKSDLWAPQTLETYEDELNSLLPTVGDLELTSILPLHNDLIRKQLGAKLGAIRVNACLNLFHAIMKDAHENKLCDAPKKPDTKRVTRSGLKEHMSPAEVNRVLRYIDPHYQPLFTFYANSGCRPGEVMALQWESIDLEAREIVIAHSRTRRGVNGPTKTGKPRRIPLTPVLMQAINDAPKSSVSDHVFTSKEGLPLSKNLDRIWRTAAIKAKINHPSYHLRHSFASTTLKRGLDLAYVAQLVGHSSVRTTAEYYLGVVKEDQREKMERLYA